MNVMRKKIALIAILATALALPASGALARGGGGGGGHVGGGGHMGGGFGGGHMGGGMHMGGMGGGHIGGRMGRPMGSPGIGPQARGAFGAPRVAGIRGVHNGRYGHGYRRHFFVGGLGYSYYNPCWDWVSTPLGWQCSWPYDY
jgi:hypothetical protein